MNMRQNIDTFRLVSLAALMLIGLCANSRAIQRARSAPAQEPRRETDEGYAKQKTSSLLARELGETVALLPWSYKNGKDAALQSAREECNQLLLETGFNVFLVKTTTGAMPPAMPNNDARKSPSPFSQILNDGLTTLGKSSTLPWNGPFTLPTVDQMASIGEKLHTRYVLAGRAQWNSRNVWIGLSNRVKSICTVDVLILDTTTNTLALDARNVMGDSTEQKNMYNTVSNAITLNPLPLVLPGSVTPQEQNAVVVAAARAMKPWIYAQRVQSAMAQADRSIELASDGAADHRFTELVQPLTVVHASLHVSGEDQKLLSAIDPDLARIMAFHDVGFDYLKPSRLLLTATTPKQEQVTLQIDGETERLSAGPNYKASVQNFAEAPSRRLSLLDFCGILTRDIFAYMRARYVRNDRRDGADLVVYDLTYWGIDDKSYQRVWIDLGKRIAVKREIYDHNGNLKTVFAYSRPRQVAPNVWAPERVDIKNGALKPVVSIAVTQVTVELEPEESAGVPLAPLRPNLPSPESPRPVGGKRAGE